MSDLTRAGNRYLDSLGEKALAMLALREEIHKARAAGLSITQIARDARVTRQTVYTILKENSK